jgi:hypothetical protein
MFNRDGQAAGEIFFIPGKAFRGVDLMPGRPGTYANASQAKKQKTKRKRLPRNQGSLEEDQ